MKIHKIFVVIILAFVSGNSLNAQNIETISTFPKPGLSGGINASTQFYSVNGRDARRSPFSYVLAGNLRFKWGLVNVPMSFSFRDQSLSYGASFNKFGISPYYKWAKVHLGHRSMRFSKYSLSGKNFFGIGTELTPGNFRLAAFRGKIRNHLAQRDTVIFGANLVPTYERKATGVKVGYGSSRNFIDLIYLKIKDDDSEQFAKNPEAIAQLDPAENLVLGTEWKLFILKNLSFNGSLNASSYTENRSLKSFNNEEGLAKFFSGLSTINPSTKASVAGELGLNFSLNSFQLGLNFRRIEPNYRSLGTPFIQADVQSYTVNTSFSFFKRKASISAQGGIEKNNLRNLDYLGRKRVIAALRLSILPMEGLNVNVNYSNYQYESVDGLVELNDTLRYINVNKALGASIAYNTKGEEFSYGAFLYVNRMTVKDLSPIQNINGDIITFTSNLGISLDWKLLNLKLKPSLIYNKFDLVNDEQRSYGLGVKIDKSFYDKKLSTGFNTRWTNNDRNGKRDGRVWSNTISVNYKVTPKQSLKANAGIIDRSSVVRTSYREFRGTIGYGLRF